MDPLGVDLPIKNRDFPSFFVCLPGRVYPNLWRSQSPTQPHGPMAHIALLEGSWREPPEVLTSDGDSDMSDRN